MGLEISGKIVQIGNAAKERLKWKIGDKECELLGGDVIINTSKQKNSQCVKKGARKRKLI